MFLYSFPRINPTFTFPTFFWSFLEISWKYSKQFHKMISKYLKNVLKIFKISPKYINKLSIVLKIGFFWRNYRLSTVLSIGLIFLINKSDTYCLEKLIPFLNKIVTLSAKMILFVEKIDTICQKNRYILSTKTLHLVNKRDILYQKKRWYHLRTIDICQQ